MPRDGGSITRRAFLHRAGVAAGGGALALSGIGAAEQPSGAGPRVAIAHCAALRGEAGLRADVLGRMVDEALMWVTGEDTPDKAWAARFSSDETVGIKPNGIAGFELSTSGELIGHCVERLAGIGVKRRRIIVWEQSRNHLEACAVPASAPPWGVRAAVTGDSFGPTVRRGTLEDRLTTIITRECDAILNLPILKDHSGAGVSLAMKSHYGSVQDPGAQHSDMHSKIADLASVPDIMAKTRLAVCDMTHCVVDGGPFGAPHYFPDSVMVATDVVAHDAVGWEVIDAERKRRGLPTLAEAGREPVHIALAAERGVGVADRSRIEVRVLSL